MAAYSDNMYGVVNGLYECNNGRLEQINNRISNRNIPSSILQPQFSSRPVSTKYALLPIVDRRPVAKEPLVQAPPFNIKQTFNPGTTTSPWSGFASSINDESRLRNQFFALQKCEQSVYVPSTNSDLYKANVIGDNIRQPYPELFKEERFNSFNPNVCNLGNKLFDNCTRVELKNMVTK